MPAICDISQEREESRDAGVAGTGRSGESQTVDKFLIQKLLTGLKKSRLLEPAAACVYWAVGGVADNPTILGNNRKKRNPLLPTIFPEAREVPSLLSLSPETGETGNKPQQRWRRDVSDDSGQHWQRRCGHGGSAGLEASCR
jgi:hypothetical protein